MLSPVRWLELSYPTRYIIADLFSIPKSGATQVVDNKVVSDGYLVSDLSQLTTAKMQAFLNSDSTDFYALFEATVNKIENPIESIQSPMLEPTPKKRGRPAKIKQENL